MSTLERCLEKLDRAGVDVLDIGCNWQEKTPVSAYQLSEQITGVLILIASCLLLYVVGEIARSHFKG
jgi:cyclopropane fatty-acyl-phospholipid synthase-like methyltransferase